MQNTRFISEALAALAVARLAEAGLPADYGLASVEALDDLIDEYSADPAPGSFFHVAGVPSPVGPWLRLVQLGCYLGEVLRRRLGGEWLDPLPTDPGPGVWALVGFPNGTAIDPVWAVTTRVDKGWYLGSFARVVIQNAEGRSAARPNGFGGPAIAIGATPALTGDSVGGSQPVGTVDCRAAVGSPATVVVGRGDGSTLAVSGTRPNWSECAAGNGARR